MDTARALPQATPPPAPAALHWRLLAMLYDLLPLAAVCLLIALLSYVLHGFAPVTPGSAGAWATFAAMLSVGFGYFAASWRRGGQTIGMRAWRLRLVDAENAGAVPGWAMLALRGVVAVLSLAAFGLGFAWSLVDRERRSWHDIASRTRLLRVPR